MAKKELLEIIENFIHSHQGDNLLLKSTKESIDDLFNQNITSKKFEDFTLDELKLQKEKILKGINNPIFQHLKGVRVKLLEKLEKINVRIEDLS